MISELILDTSVVHAHSHNLGFIDLEKAINVHQAVGNATFLISSESSVPSYSFDGSHNFGLLLQKLPKQILHGHTTLTYEAHDQFNMLDGVSFNPMSGDMLKPFKLFRLIIFNIYSFLEILVTKGWEIFKPIFVGPGNNVGMPQNPAELSSANFIQPSFPMDFRKENFFWYKYANDPVRERFRAGIEMGYLEYDFQYNELAGEHDLPHVGELQRILVGPGKRFPDSLSRRNAELIRQWKYYPLLTYRAPLEILQASIKRYNFNSPEGSPMSFYIEPARNMMFVPDFLEKFLYLTFSARNMSYDNAYWNSLAVAIAGSIIIYLKIGGLKQTMENSFVGINPFSNIVTTLIYKAYTPWIEKALWFVPKIANLPMSYTLFFGLLGKVNFVLYHLVFTMPYVPSQGVLKTEKIAKEEIEALFFEGIPESWQILELIKSDSGIVKVLHLSVPNIFRESWYEKHHDIFNFVSSACGDANILPDTIDGSIHHFSPYYFTLSNIIIRVQETFNLLFS